MIVQSIIQSFRAAFPFLPGSHGAQGEVLSVPPPAPAPAPHVPVLDANRRPTYRASDAVTHAKAVDVINAGLQFTERHLPGGLVALSLSKSGHTFLSDICSEQEAPDRLRRLIARAHADLDEYTQQARPYSAFDASKEWKTKEE